MLQTSTIFQFHNGTIKTNGRMVEGTAIVLFQFHNGTIKTQQMMERPLLMLFISIP